MKSPDLYIVESLMHNDDLLLITKYCRRIEFSLILFPQRKVPSAGKSGDVRFEMYIRRSFLYITSIATNIAGPQLSPIYHT